VDVKFKNVTYIRSSGYCMLGIIKRDRKRNIKVADIAERVKKLKWIHTVEKTGWQMDATNAGMVSERM
jgi:hypothetical protein